MARTGRYDAIVVGGGHNGLVCAAYLARAGRRVMVLESRPVLGGACGTFEFMPGYRASFANSPGSFEPRVIEELELERFGLSFIRTDPTVIQPFAEGCFVGWRDRQRVAAQLDAYAAGEGQRYADLLDSLEGLARVLDMSVFEPSPDLATLARRVPDTHRRLFEKVFFGSLTQLLDETLRSGPAKALLGMVAMNATMAPPSAPGTAVGLMLRPLSIASTPPLGPDDPRRIPLRGSTGLPRGGMGAVIDALARCCEAAGATLRTGARVRRLTTDGDGMSGVELEDGETIAARTVIASVNPKALLHLLPADALPAATGAAMAGLPMRGSAFKIALALDGLPAYAGLPPDVARADAASVQFRIAPSLDYIERAVADVLAGRPSTGPIMWGLIPSATSPELTPEGRHILSINVWHAPYAPQDGPWDAARRDAFGRHCIDVVGTLMPDLAARITGQRFMDPVELEAELGMVGSNITHGDMLPAHLFGARPDPSLHGYRTPLAGLYLSGAGTWPGGYVTGIPGRNAGRAVLADRLHS